MDLITIGEAAERFGVSVSSLRRWVQAGLLPDRRTGGGHRRFDPQEIQELLENRWGDDSIILSRREP